MRAGFTLMTWYESIVRNLALRGEVKAISTTVLLLSAGPELVMTVEAHAFKSSKSENYGCLNAVVRIFYLIN
eukprot:IDg11965t1